MIRRPPSSTPTDTLLPYSTLFRSFSVPESRHIAMFQKESRLAASVPLRGSASPRELLTRPLFDLCASARIFPNGGYEAAPQRSVIISPSTFTASRFARKLDRKSVV